MRRATIMVMLVLLVFLTGCNSTTPADSRVQKDNNEQNLAQENSEVNNDDEMVAEKEYEENTAEEPQSLRSLAEVTEELVALYQGHNPLEWGERVSGVINSIETEDKIIALTFDACGGGPLGNGYDDELITFLIDNEIPATLFISGNWIDNNAETFAFLAETPIFSIQNHGYKHKPLSVRGESAYGIPGTASIAEVIEEIYLNDEKIAQVTGTVPQYFRSGTAFYDEVAVSIANEMGKEVVNFSVVGDGGASFSQQQIFSAVVNARPGSIVLLHMNRPDTNIAQGVIDAVQELKQRGFSFVTLDEYHEQLSEAVVR